MPLSKEDVEASTVLLSETESVSRNDIPVIDVSALLGASDVGIDEVAEQFEAAFRDVGFCYIVGHGVSETVIDRAFSVLPDFFLGLSEEEKARVTINKNQRGWLAMERQVQLHGKLPNHSESFIFGLDLPEDDPDRKSGVPFYDTNQWPSNLPEFRSIMEEYWNALWNLAPKLMGALAIAMKQKSDFFESRCRKPPGYVRCVTYPPLEGEFDGRYGAGPHTDTGGLTILAQDDVGGLQIRRRDGVWIDAPVIPNAFVVNIGDMIMRLTNGYFRSTPHRVLCSRERRYSLPFFYGFDYNVEIAPLADFCSEENEPRWEPVIWGDYALRAFRKQYDQFKQ